ncbi:hypothetical protein KI387_024568, partial [Taxus chinensis]
MHSRNKKAKEFIGKGWSAIQEVDRVLPYTEPEDELLTPLLKSAKQNFELALEVDNLNTQAKALVSTAAFEILCSWCLYSS